MFMLDLAERRKYGVLRREESCKCKHQQEDQQSWNGLYTQFRIVREILFMWPTKIATGNNGWPSTHFPLALGSGLCSPPPHTPTCIQWILINPLLVHELWLQRAAWKGFQAVITMRRRVRGMSRFHYLFKAPRNALNSSCLAHLCVHRESVNQQEGRAASWGARGNTIGIRDKVLLAFWMLCFCV